MVNTNSDKFVKETYKLWLPDESEPNIDFDKSQAENFNFYQSQNLATTSLPPETKSWVSSSISEQDLEGNIIEKVSKHIDDFERQFNISNFEKMVLVVGNSGSGKSTLINFLAGDDLVAKDINGTVVIDNKTETKLGIGHSSESKTFFPQPLKISGVTYCDLPGFSENRGLDREIAAAIFLKKVVNYVSEIKLLVTISYSSILDTRFEQIKSLLRTLSRFMPTIDILGKSVGVVVTKVENKTLRRGGYKTDEELIGNICKKLEKFLSNEKEYQNSFLNSVIKQKRLRIFRSPLELEDGVEEEPLKDMMFGELGYVFNIEKKSIQQLITTNITYLSKEEFEFGYSVSEKAQLDQVGIASKLKDSMSENLVQIFTDVKEYYKKKVKNTTDIYELKELLNPTNWTEDSINPLDWKGNFQKDNPISVLNYIIQKVNEFGVDITEAKFQEFKRKNEFLELLIEMSDAVDNNIDYKALSEFVQYLKDREDYIQQQINFLNIKLDDDTIKDLEDLISKFIKVNNKKDLEDLISKFIKVNNKFDRELSLNTGELVACMVQEPTVENKETDKRIVIHGHIIKLSEVSKLIEGKEFNHLGIYSSNTIILDNEKLKLPGKNVSIIAPKWYVQGNSQIILDGEDAEEHSSSKADDGKEPGDNGKDGLPGKPGNSAGNFLGVGSKFENSVGLTISADGGKGGKGQDGGNGCDGDDGEDGKDAKEAKNDDNDTSQVIKGKRNSIYVADKYIVFGKDGENGGNAGKGGQGGYSGKPGIIEIIGKQKISRKNNQGETGKNGKHGKHGEGGKAGKDAVIIKSGRRRGKVMTLVMKWREEKLEKSCKAHDGEAGKTAKSLGESFNNQEIKTPEDAEMNWYKPLIEYKKYMLNNLDNKFLKHNTEEFFEQLTEIQKATNQNQST